MASEKEELYRAGQHNGGSAKEAMREASRQARAEVSEEVDRLIDDVENLIRRVGEAADPEVRRLRGEVQSAIAETKRALRDRSAGWAQRQAIRAKEAFEASDRYVHEQPWQTVGIAAVTGLLIGCLVGIGRR
jgi:ElaB/YqjD/DUF883 family membrane-anchored ribosome-binding protein